MMSITKRTVIKWRTNGIDVTAWGKTADIIEKYVVKGKEIGIEGKLTHRSYDDKKTVTLCDRDCC
jgi:single-stranded DNA-binding protein